MKNSEKTMWLIFAIIAVLFFLTLSYVDLYTTYSRSLLLLDSVFSGSFPHGYFFEGAFYVFIHIVLAIWCIPVWVLIKIGIVSELSIVCILWAKLLIVVLAFVSLLFTYKLLEISNIGDKRTIIFLIISSPLFFLPCFATGQYDVIELSIALISFFYIVKDNRLGCKEALILSLAISVKFLFIFPAVIILLLYEKKPFRIIGKSILLLSFSAIFYAFSLVSQKIAPETGSVELGGEFASRLFKTTIEGPYNNISVFFLFFFILCFFAYLCKKPDGSAEATHKISWFTSATYSIFFTFVATNPNWPLLIVPFLLIIIFSTKKTIRFNLLAELLLTISFLIQHICHDKGCCYINEKATNLLVLKHCEHNYALGKNCTAAYGILREFHIDMLLPAVAAISVSSLIVVLVVNNPWKSLNKGTLSSADVGISTKTAIITRMIILCLYFILQLLVSFVI